MTPKKSTKKRRLVLQIKTVHLVKRPGKRSPGVIPEDQNGKIFLFDDPVTRDTLTRLARKFPDSVSVNTISEKQLGILRSKGLIIHRIPRPGEQYAGYALDSSQVLFR